MLLSVSVSSTSVCEDSDILTSQQQMMLYSLSSSTFLLSELFECLDLLMHLVFFGCTLFLEVKKAQKANIELSIHATF